MGKIEERIVEEIARMAFVPSKELNNEDGFGFIRVCGEPELKPFNQRVGIRVGVRVVPIMAEASALPYIERVYSEIKKRQGRLFVALTNNEIHEIRPHDVVTADEGYICFCRLRTRMMESTGRPILIVAENA